ncbi:hypothetical protein KR074_002056, partial [Drosophila pseudoananassae]
RTRTTVDTRSGSSVPEAEASTDLCAGFTSPGFRKHFCIQCEASHVGIGAVLFQKDDNKAERPIAFFSAKLRGAQLNQGVTEKECPEIPYIQMMNFTILTDQESLKWLMSFKNLEGRLARWLALQPYQFYIEHRNSKDNVVADTLSRPNDVEELSLLNMETTAFTSEKYLKRTELVKKKGDRFLDLRVEKGLLFKKTHFRREDSEEFDWKLWIHKELTSTLVQQ